MKVISLSRPARFLVLSLRTASSLQLELNLNEIRLPSRVLASRCLNIDSLLLLWVWIYQVSLPSWLPHLPRPKAHLRSNTYGSVADTSPYKCFERGNIPENQPLNIIKHNGSRSNPFRSITELITTPILVPTWSYPPGNQFVCLLISCSWRTEGNLRDISFFLNPVGITLVPLPPMVIEMQSVSSWFLKGNSSDGSILCPVGDWAKVWDDAGSGNPNNYSLWRGVTMDDDCIVLVGFFVSQKRQADYQRNCRNKGHPQRLSEACAGR